MAEEKSWSREELLEENRALRAQLEQANANIEDDDNEKNLTTWVYRLNKMTRGKNRHFYFVFDGFDNLPVVFVDGIKSVLAPLFTGHGYLLRNRHGIQL